MASGSAPLMGAAAVAMASEPSEKTDVLEKYKVFYPVILCRVLTMSFVTRLRPHVLEEWERAGGNDCGPIELPNVTRVMRTAMHVAIARVLVVQILEEGLSKIQWVGPPSASTVLCDPAPHCPDSGTFYEHRTLYVNLDLIFDLLGQY